MEQFMAVKPLKKYFPVIREKREILEEIERKKELHLMYEQWTKAQQEEFLDYCCGNRGMRILYDSFFKEVMNVEYDSTRLEDFLCTVLKKKVKIVKILPNDSTRIAEETTLLITDIVVELEDGALANVEIQKIGYMFPGPRCACYSADLLLRQYKRVRDRQRENFSYKDIRDVYLIVIYEKSPPEFKAHPDVYYHSGKYVFDTGLEMNMLQNYVMIPLDIFRKCMQNKAIENRLEAWLTFLSEDRPEKIIELITAYPEFKAMYQTLYDMCLNVERVMRMFSRELAEMDRNTVKLMIEENQRVIDEQQKQMNWQQEQLEQQQEQLEQQQEQLEQQQEQLEQRREQLDQTQEQLGQTRDQLDQAREKLAQKEEQIALLQKELETYRKRG